MMNSIRFFMAFALPVLLWLGALVGTWIAFAPETFWQRLVTAIIELFVATGVGFGCFLLGLVLLDRAENLEYHDKRKNNGNKANR